MEWVGSDHYLEFASDDDAEVAVRKKTKDTYKKKKKNKLRLIGYLFSRLRLSQPVPSRATGQAPLHSTTLFREPNRKSGFRGEKIVSQELGEVKPFLSPVVTSNPISKRL